MIGIKNTGTRKIFIDERPVSQGAPVGQDGAWIQARWATTGAERQKSENG